MNGNGNGSASLLQLGKYGLVSVMFGLILLASYGMYSGMRATEACIQIHDKTNELLTRNAIALEQLSSTLKNFK